ncbi:MAG: chemotaxis protein CheR [Methylococcaceae bacterium]|nr:MAG: chemotaxis protein CheR [Methylococcaceae bacterium]
MLDKKRKDASSGHEASDREFAFTVADFKQIRQMLYDHAGINLNDSKKDMVYSRLARRLRANRLSTFQEYLQLLERDDETEWEAFINSLTTNLTSFFREPHHFPILADFLRSQPNKRSFRIWCCAASTGEEPYTLAMTAINAFGTFSPPVEIIATDIDTHVLAKAEAGIYAMERLNKLPRDVIKRFFLKGTGEKEGYAKVRKELRQMISFQPLNLLDPRWPLQGAFDAIFCRNVMIYFDKNTQYKILQRFAPLLEPHGLLFVGHSESLHHATEFFRLRKQTVYELAASRSNKPESHGPHTHT